MNMNLKNTYYMLRHGEAQSNVRDVCSSWPETFENPLTEAGVQMIHEAAELLADKKIEMIFASDLLRTKQTAGIVAEALGLTVTFEEKLREIQFGDMNGKPATELEVLVGRHTPPGYRVFGGENYADVADRVFAFLQELELRYIGKTILLVSHQSPLWLLEEKVRGFGVMEIAAKVPGYWQMKRGEVRELVVAQDPVINEEVAV